MSDKLDQHIPKNPTSKGAIMNIYRFIPANQTWVCADSGFEARDAEKKARSLSSQSHGYGMFAVGEDNPAQKQPSKFFWHGLGLQLTDVKLAMPATGD